MSEEAFVVVAFFVLMGLLVSRIVREERQQVVCSERLGPRRATTGRNELRDLSETCKDTTTSSSSAGSDNELSAQYCRTGR